MKILILIIFMIIFQLIEVTNGKFFTICGSKKTYAKLTNPDDLEDYENDSNMKCSFFNPNSYCDLAYSGGICVCDKGPACVESGMRLKNCSKQKYEKGKANKDCAKKCKEMEMIVGYVCQSPVDKHRYCVCVDL